MYRGVRGMVERALDDSHRSLLFKGTHCHTGERKEHEYKP